MLEWLEFIESDDNDQLEVVNSTFDHIIDAHNFGKIIDRSNQSTNLALENTDSSKTDAIVEIIFARQGATSICKIMDVIPSPEITSKDDDEYQSYYIDILLSALAILLQINSSTKHGLTKIYARNDMARQAIHLIENVLNGKNVKIGDLNFEVKLQGPSWLMFEKI